MWQSFFITAIVAAFSVGMIAAPSAAQEYVALKGAAKKAFEKSKGESRAGRKISIEISGADIEASNLKPWGKSERFVSFTHGGVEYVVERGSPYLEQTMRKCAEKKTPSVLVKGAVVSAGPENEKHFAVMIDTLQVIEKLPRKAPAKKKDASEKKSEE